MVRMTDILRADELKAAKDKYDLWLKLDQAGKKAAYATAVGDNKRVNRASRTAFIQPFGVPDNFWYETKALAPATEAPTPTPKEINDAALISLVITATITTTPFVVLSVPEGANNISNRAKKIQFAKVKCTERTGAGADTISRFTGRSYLKYNTNTISSPFRYAGGTTDKTEQAAARVLRTSLLGTTPPGNRFVSFTPQGDVGNIVNATP
jgi:hypothetical protein